MTIKYVVNVYFRLYMNYYNSEDKIVNMLLAFMNQIQAMYHFKSLGRKVDFTIVHLELMKAAAFPEHGGERLQLLTEFCKYQVNANFKNDISSILNCIILFSVENKRSG